MLARLTQITFRPILTEEILEGTESVWVGENQATPIGNTVGNVVRRLRQLRTVGHTGTGGFGLRTLGEIMSDS